MKLRKSSARHYFVNNMVEFVEFVLFISLAFQTFGFEDELRSLEETMVSSTTGIHLRFVDRCCQHEIMAEATAISRETTARKIHSEIIFRR